MNAGALPPRGFVIGLLAILLAAGGLLAFERGLQARVEAEPTALVTGAGFLPGVDGDADAEIRTPVSVTLIAPGVRALGAGRRRAGAAMMAAALALAAALLCEQPDPADRGCGECSACRTVRGALDRYIGCRAARLARRYCRIDRDTG